MLREATRVRHGRALAAIAVALAAMIAGCTTSRAPTGSPTGSPSDPSPGPTTPAGPSSAEAPTASPVTAPPPAWLLLPDGTRVAGEPGSWAIDGAGSEVPWLPASALEALSVVPDMTLAVELGDGLPIGAWRADVAAAADATGAGARPSAGRETDTPPVARLELPPLDRGSWVVRVTLWFADGRGDAAYSWAVEVPAG